MASSLDEEPVYISLEGLLTARETSMSSENESMAFRSLGESQSGSGSTSLGPAKKKQLRDTGGGGEDEQGSQSSVARVAAVFATGRGQLAKHTTSPEDRQRAGFIGQHSRDALGTISGAFLQVLDSEEQPVTLGQAAEDVAAGVRRVVKAQVDRVTQLQRAIDEILERCTEATDAMVLDALSENGALLVLDALGRDLVSERIDEFLLLWELINPLLRARRESASPPAAAAATAESTANGWAHKYLQAPEAVGTQLTQDWPVASDGNKTALILLVGDYAFDKKKRFLKAIDKESKLLKKGLEAKGFHTTLVPQEKLQEVSGMRAALAEFASSASSYEVSVIIASGHGVQLLDRPGHDGVRLVAGRGFRRGCVSEDALPFCDIVEAATASKSNLVLYGACREDAAPFM